jgi:hypothetical protein
LWDGQKQTRSGGLQPAEPKTTAICKSPLLESRRRGTIHSGVVLLSKLGLKLNGLQVGRAASCAPKPLRRRSEPHPSNTQTTPKPADSQIRKNFFFLFISVRSA